MCICLRSTKVDFWQPLVRSDSDTKPQLTECVPCKDRHKSTEVGVRRHKISVGLDQHKQLTPTIEKFSNRLFAMIVIIFMVQKTHTDSCSWISIVYRGIELFLSAFDKFLFLLIPYNSFTLFLLLLLFMYSKINFVYMETNYIYVRKKL